jgi:hypothetical protein
MTALPLTLVQGYLKTHFKVLPPEGFTLVADRHSPELARLHREYGVDCSAFVTACNPFSDQLIPELNAERQSSLAEELRREGFATLDGLGQHPSNGWPGEPSFLVLGLPLEASRLLGIRLGQNAIIWSGGDAVPKLILLR